MAQRAYRSRKETEIVSLNQRIDQLEVLLKQIVETFSSFSDELIKSNVLKSYPHLAEALHRTTQRYFALTNQATSIIDNDYSSQSTDTVKTREYDAGNNESQSITQNLYQDVRLTQQPQGGNERRGPSQLLPTPSDDALAAADPLKTFPAPEMIWNNATISLDIETPRFAHRLHRACAEYGYRCLRDPASSPEIIAQRFNFLLRMLTREHITMHFQTLLRMGHRRYCETFHVPFFSVGGAGTHYSHPERHYFNKSAVYHIQPQQASPVMTGDWFDCYDVEGFLKENNIILVQDHFSAPKSSSHLYPSDVNDGQPENQYGPYSSETGSLRGDLSRKFINESALINCRFLRCPIQLQKYL